MINLNAFSNKSFKGDNPYISGKTQAGSAIQLEIALTYRIKYEFLFDLFLEYPSQNQKTDMITSAKVIFLNIWMKLKEFNRVQFKMWLRIITMTISLLIEFWFLTRWALESTVFSKANSIVRSFHFFNIFFDFFSIAHHVFTERNTSCDHLWRTNNRSASDKTSDDYITRKSNCPSLA